MSLDFEKYAQKGNEFVHLVADDLKVPRDKAGRIIRAVLHALRNRLTLEESFHLLAQMPVALKGVYVDGWNVSQEFRRMHNLEDFLDEVRKEDHQQAGYDFGNNAKAGEAVSAVFRAMERFVSPGEMEDVIKMLPKDLQAILKPGKVVM
jgi:uncharacterized protein (DUF2267 family)